MRLVLLYGAASLVALGLQTEALHWLPLGAFVPDLVLILVVDLGLNHHSVPAALLAFAMGYATDSLSGSQIGPSCFMLTLLFLLAFEVSRRLLVSGYLLSSVLLFLAALLKTVGVLALSAGWRAIARNGAATAEQALGQALITALFALGVFPLLAQAKVLLRLPLRIARE